MTMSEQAVSQLLEGTIEALASFDLERLETLEARIRRLAISGVTLHATRSLLEQRNRLERTLEETGRNVQVVARLCAAKGAERWER